MKHTGSVMQNIKQFKYKSIYFRYLRSYCVILFTCFLGLLLILSAYITYNFNRQLEKQTYEIALKTSAISDYTFSEINSVLNNVSADQNVIFFMNYKEDFDTSFAIQRQIRNVAEFIEAQMNLFNNISEIVIYNTYNNKIISYNTFGEAESFKNKDWYSALTDNPGNTATISNINGKICIRSSINGGYVMVTAQSPFESMVEEFSSLYVYRTATKQLIYSSDENIIPLKDTSAITHTFKDSNKDYCVQTKSNYWFTYIYRAHSYDPGGEKSFLILIIAMCAVLFAVLAFLSIKQTSLTYSNISKILALFKSDDDAVNDKSFDEWYYISNNIINILNQNQDFEQRIKNQLDELQKAQSVALQAQITPHFMFNTLMMINMSIQNTIKGDCAGTQMITKLSELLRIVLSTKENIIPVSLEAEHARKYLELQQLKYPNLSFSFRIQQECNNLKVPKLILQPLIENSIIHGMKQEEPLQIKVKISKMGAYIKITVKDNGVGMSKEDIRNITDIESDSTKKRGIGIYNVIKRLKILYGNKSNFNIKSNPDNGTLITIIIPDSYE